MRRTNLWRCRPHRVTFEAIRDKLKALLAAGVDIDKLPETMTVNELMRLSTKPKSRSK
jgi:hypothetical protein